MAWTVRLTRGPAAFRAQYYHESCGRWWSKQSKANKGLKRVTNPQSLIGQRCMHCHDTFFWEKHLLELEQKGKA